MLKPLHILIDSFVGVFLALASLACLILSPLGLLLLPFIKWDKSQSQVNGWWCTRGDWPKWLSWLGTPDERLPGDMTIEEVRAIGDKHGRVLCAWNWCFIRNRLFGLAHALRVDCNNYIPETYGWYSRTDTIVNSDATLIYEQYIWRFAVKLGFLKLVIGHQVYRHPENYFYSVPVFTIKRP